MAFLLYSCFSLQPALNGAPGFICWSRGFMELGVTGSRAELVDSLKVYSSHRGNPPLLLFPEEAATNGRAGLLRFRYSGQVFLQRGCRHFVLAFGSFSADFFLFSSWPFSVVDVVQPVALQVQRPLITVVSQGRGARRSCGGVCCVRVLAMALILLLL